MILRRVRLGIVAVGKQYVFHILTVCVSVVLVIQHAKRMRCIILPSVTCLTPPYFSIIFSHYLLNGTIFEKRSY